MFTAAYLRQIQTICPETRSRRSLGHLVDDLSWFHDQGDEVFDERRSTALAKPRWSPTEAKQPKRNNSLTQTHLMRKSTFINKNESGIIPFNKSMNTKVKKEIKIDFFKTINENDF